MIIVKKIILWKTAICHNCFKSLYREKDAYLVKLKYSPIVSEWKLCKDCFDEIFKNVKKKVIKTSEE